MSDTVTVAGFDVGVRVSARARRMTLRVGRSDGRVSVSVPRGTSIGVATAFVEAHVDWIARQVAAVPPVRGVAVGARLPVLGQEVPVIAGSGRSARWTGDAIAVPDDSRAGARVKALLREMARSHLVASVEGYAEALGRPFGRITLRDTRSRWGSCSGRGDLMFSWRLVMAPSDVLDYVAAHEVAHLAHMDHSARFWSCVAGLMPDYAPRRAWLRREGGRLHAIDFG